MSVTAATGRGPALPDADDFAQQVLAGVAAVAAGGRRPLDLVIHQDDEMLGYEVQKLGLPLGLALQNYFATGLMTVRMLDEVLAWAGRDLRQTGSLLDFACGYGRGTRWLVRELDPARVWVSDVLAPAVAFQAAQFGVRPQPSATDPRQIRFGRSFDVITVISLFTHLPERTFAVFLRLLADALAPGGVLVFTTTGIHGHPLAGTDWRGKDFVFNPISESKTLDTAEYGSTFCTPAFVARVCAETLPAGTRLLGSAARGLNFQQDVNVVARDLAGPSTPLRLSLPTRMEIDVARRDGGSLHLAGWALGREGGPPQRLAASVDGTPLGTVEAALPRPDVQEVFQRPHALRCGFDVRLPLPAGSRPRVAALRALDAGGFLGFRAALCSD